MLAEVSDQNFVDEDIKEEKTLGSCDAKRMKALILDVANNDQVMYNALCMPKTKFRLFSIMWQWSLNFVLSYLHF